MNRPSWRLRTGLTALALALLAAGCGTEGGEPAESVASGGEPGAAVSEGELEVAPGTVIDTADCPTGWSNTGGVTEDEVVLATSLPESGPVAALGEIDDGIRAYLQHINETDPIAGREIVLESADDGYDPARTLTNVEEALSTETPFAFVDIVGTPNNLAVRDLLNDECVPQLFSSSGFPGWGAPEEYPWTIGGLLSYQTEARIWCDYLVDELGEGASVAGLFISNEFGASYRDEIEACAEEGLIDLVEAVNHEPATPDVTGDITTLAASDADALVLGTTGAPCSQSMSALASSSWDPVTILSNTCQTISSYFTPVDPAGEGVLVAANRKTAGDPQYDDDPAVQEAIEILEEAGLDPYAGSSYTGLAFAHSLVEGLRAAAEMEGGLTRLNMMRAVWNADWTNPLLLEGMTEQTDGVNDAYLVEAARMAAYQPPAEGEQSGSYEFVTDLIDVEGETGAFEEQ